MGLERYGRKRNFGRTPEPEGKDGRSAAGNLYVIQKHAARSLHYDLRLELNGVLKSWAVPRGPSLDPSEKRLAVHVEDHPVAYGAFEGVIPEGEYGAGTVLLWDRGTWEPLGDPEKDYRRGRLGFRLHGEKLRGAWSLARMGAGCEHSENWLLIKKDDEEARPESEGFLEKNALSVASGRSVEQIAAERDRVWTGKESASDALKGEKGFSPAPGRLPGARAAKQPERLIPQSARLVEAIPLGGEWLHEIKLDGYRIVCVLREGRVVLWSRNGLDWTHRFAPIAAAAARLPLRDAILDGEVVVINAQGFPDFQALQNLLQGVGSGRLVYYVFDLVHCLGHDLSRVPLSLRKGLLREVLSSAGPDSPLRFSDHIQGEGERVYRHACRHGLEGIVSKRAESPYLQKRSGDWVKVKCVRRQELLIGGFSAPSGTRAGFGALLLGYRDGEGRLLYAGRVGTGFDDNTLRLLSAELEKREIRDPPFFHPPRGAEARGVRWVRPELVAEIAFSSWTEDGRLRHPSFKGLREDKSPLEIVRETPESLRLSSPSPEPDTTAPADDVVAGVTLTNPDRILYPEQGITKRDLALYYRTVGERMLPFVAGRPLTVVRCPQGREKDCFYQKHLNESVPPPVRGIPIPEKEGEGLCLVVDDLPGVITLVQLGVLEFHPWSSREDRLERPDQVIFDLDPGPEVTWEDVVHAARQLRKRLSDLDLASFVKTSGGKGLHVVAPLVRRSEWEEVRAFSQTVAEDLARRDPGRYVTTMSKAQRRGKIFIDYFRNTRGATSVAPYSTRARPGAPVSAPLFWDELSADIGPDFYTIANLPGRLERLKEDPWAGFFGLRQSITREMRRELGF